jgi:acetolactate synthase I/III small subunit
MRHIIAIRLQNEAGALSRVAGLFSTRGYNIESLSVAPTDDPTVSRITLVTSGSDAVIGQINAQLLKLVDVASVEDLTSGEHLARELMLIKVHTTHARSDALNDLAHRAGGKVLSPNPGSFIIELASTETQISQFIAEVGAFGEVLEVVRSGALGIAHANPKIHAVR